MELPAWSSPSGPVGSLVALGVSFLVSKSSIFVEVSALPGELNFNSFALSSTGKVALSEFERGSCSALPNRAIVTAAFSLGEGLNWRIVVMVGVTMVGDFSSDAFAHNELLAECLAGCAVLGMAAPTACFDSSLVSLPVVKLRAGIFECVFSTTEVHESD